MADQTSEFVTLTEHIRCTVPSMMPNLAERIAGSLITYVEAAEDRARAEALEVAGLLLRKVADYWDGRPLRLHGEHIYADLIDVLTSIEKDAKHNRQEAGRG